MKFPKLLTIVLGLDLQIYTSYISYVSLSGRRGKQPRDKKAYAAVVLQKLRIL